MTEEHNEQMQPDEEKVEDLDVSEEESEDVKGGAFDAFQKFNKVGIKGELKIQPNTINLDSQQFYK